ncbi:hypothetical protein B7Y92_02585 [Candidatus Saccharibacteria bacterium 32-50-13]|nr:MAG: hypothetical protein B7Y92_02585 [Candidatus Saccharibacteria bacterium 32-50-13]
MLSFLSSFSTSFLAAVLIWPFLAVALTLPILIMQYRRYKRYRLLVVVVTLVVWAKWKRLLYQII